MNCNNCGNCGKLGSGIGKMALEPSTIIINNEYFKHRHLPGSFKHIDKDNVVRQVSISKVLYNNPATVVFWDDGSKTVSKCDRKDTYSAEMGLLLCIAKKIYGPTYMKTLLDAWMPQSNNPEWKTLSDVRKASR